jgi:hypothetical protein
LDCRYVALGGSVDVALTCANLCQQFLFLEPNASDPLNKDAAEDLRSNREGFKRNVRTAMGGGPVRGVPFERVLK